MCTDNQEGCYETAQVKVKGRGYLPGSHVVARQNVGFSSEWSPQSLSPSHSHRRRMHTLLLPHLICPGGHVVGAGNRGHIVGAGNRGHVVGVGNWVYVVGVGNRGYFVGVGNRGYFVGVRNRGQAVVI